MYNILSGKRILAASTVMALAFIMVMGPSSMAFNVFATTNDLEQEIEQSQYSTQLGVCVSGDGTLFSCNNLNVQLQNNEGSNAAAQSSDDDGEDNEAEQEIEQEQSSEQSALCVSGSGTFLSCNNINVQAQNNEGSNALAQSSGGYGGGDNEAEQEIEQEQSSEQSSQVVSGDDSVLSGNNVNVQLQNNEGSNAAAQSSGGDYEGGDNHDNGKHHDDNGGDNEAEQEIEQEQSSEQDSDVSSGDDSVGSGNNVNVQAQNNEGSNAAAQE